MDARLATALDWSASVVGPCEIASSDTRFHGRETVLRLRTADSHCYLKLHEALDSWGQEVHGYEQWAPAFGELAPRLLGICEQEPLALLISELPGKILDSVEMPVAQERAAWRAAGEALVALHAVPAGDHFGPCRRDGSPIGEPITDAVRYMRSQLDEWMTTGLRLGVLTDEEQRDVAAARTLASCFAGERPTACHRDYDPVNWMVDDAGRFCGVIDFEFAYWDTRITEFARYPDWDWWRRPDLLEAIQEGYGHMFTPIEEQQLLVANAQYALGAIVWGAEHEYYGFMEEGQQGMAALRESLR